MKTVKLLILMILLYIPLIVNAVDLSKLKIGGEIRMRGYELRNVWDFDSFGLFLGRDIFFGLFFIWRKYSEGY